jgi:hypothetical protein
MSMGDKYNAPVISPDGRFEIIIEDSYDRGIHDPYTVLVERATGERIFSCEGSPRAEFVGDSLLTIHYPGYAPLGVQIDPVNRVFRTHPSDPWVPIAAWGLVESAYKRGWAECFSYKQQSQPAPFPWVAIILLLGSIVALIALGSQTFLSNARSAALMVVASIGVLFFGWLTADSVRIWMQEKIRERTQARSEGDMSQSPRP